jgi:hypothetical protein
MNGHPTLHAGFNADDINADEVDGAGTNWRIAPVLFDSFIALDVFILTPEMLAAFDECPDFVVAADWPAGIVPAEANVFTAAVNDWTVCEVSAREPPILIRADWLDATVPAEDTTIVLPKRMNTAELRRQT